MGKEYWFMHFNSPPGESQVVLTLGRSAEAVEVNSSVSAVPGKGSPESISCAAVCWLYSGSKQVIFDSLADVRIERGKAGCSLEAAGGDGKVRIRGSYPDFSISISKRGKEVFSARATAPRMGMPYELVQLLNAPIMPRLSSVLVNYYFDFTGKLNGKPFSGKAYLQKVVAVMPLAPWNWVRVNFASGASIDFFAGKPFGHSSEVRFADNAYFEHQGRRVKLAGRLALSSFMDGESRVWLLTGRNLFLSMRTYSLQPFVMKQRTTFRYDEYLVRATDFAFRSGGTEHSLSSLGGGVGIVEEASGYLF